MIQAAGVVILMANKGNLKARALSKWIAKKQRNNNALGQANVFCNCKASEDYQSNAYQREIIQSQNCSNCQVLFAKASRLKD